MVSLSSTPNSATSSVAPASVAARILPNSLSDSSTVSVSDPKLNSEKVEISPGSNVSAVANSVVSAGSRVFWSAFSVVSDGSRVVCVVVSVVSIDSVAEISVLSLVSVVSAFSLFS